MHCIIGKISELLVFVKDQISRYLQSVTGMSVFLIRLTQRRGAIQADIFSPPCFTVGLDRIFLTYDTKCEGIAGAHMISPTTSKLEFVDNVGLLNETAADASLRTSTLATGSKGAATMEISLKNT